MPRIDAVSGAPQAGGSMRYNVPCPEALRRPRQTPCASGDLQVLNDERWLVPALTDQSVGDLVVLGHDGVARIEAITENAPPNGTTLKLHVLSQRMTVTIPLERALERGLRSVAEPAVAQNALERLQVEAGMETMSGLTWDKQLKRLKERFGTGDLDGIVDVLATLVDADARRPLNHSQRMLRDKAEEALVTEVAATFSLDDEDARRRVQDVLDARLARE